MESAHLRSEYPEADDEVVGLVWRSRRTCVVRPSWVNPRVGSVSVNCDAASLRTKK